ncbi:MAG: alpha-ketoacid dehydrogenase subunit beta [Thaumarchaeota archaeon]|nr:alpha-ketoacid dehydrogenase subunit beta [Candidatus Calditenuaceae archaeon]MDW8186570.1 alpha-ketoacid dehydrogenase subunit beta [Nitrososphaerota archaeon]
MTVMTFAKAINDALRYEMRRDERVVVLGEDIGVNGGVFRCTEHLLAEFGPSRVIDTPLSESAIIGVAIGMAMNGLRPIAEIQFSDFIYGGFEQLVSNLAKVRYRSASHYFAPVVVRTPVGGGVRGGMYHSQSPEAYFAHTAGLKVIIPSTPSDAKGLLLSSIRNDDPVIFFEPKRLYHSMKEDVPEGEHTVPLGKARLVREGDDVSVITYGATVYDSLEAAERAAQEGVSVEVLDLRSLVPYDWDAISKSVKKTGRPVIVHEAPRTAGFGAEIAATIAEREIYSLEAPIIRVTGYDTPYPLVHERLYLPNPDRILEAVRRSIGQ